MRWILVGSVLLAAGVAPTAGQEPSPYVAGSDSIRTLSAEEVAGLLTGEGMGLARPAELNGYPGPRHVLGLADSLGLTAAQRGATEAVFEEMRERAVAVGRAVLEAERALDAAFAAGEPPEELMRLVDRAASAQGELRWIHLEAHLRMREILTPAQAVAYDRLRGYAPVGHDPSRHH